MSRLEALRNCKVKSPKRQETVRFLELLFYNGFSWKSDRSTIYRHLGRTHFLVEEGLVTVVSKESFKANVDLIEMGMLEIFDKVYDNT